MITHTYRIAEKNIRIISRYAFVQKYCADYRAEGTPDFAVTVSEEDIAFEWEKSRREDAASGHGERLFSAPYLESLAVYRKIAEQMPVYDTFLFHGSAVAMDGEGYLFTAASGTGKSTHTKLWMDSFGERAVMINDDKPLLRVGDGCVTVFGTPYNGKHRRGCNRSVPLRAVCALERGTDNVIEPVGRNRIYPLLLQQTYRPADPAMLVRTLTLLDRMTECVAFYHLRCNMDIEAAKVAYHGMKG